METMVALTINVAVYHDTKEELVKALCALEEEGAWIHLTTGDFALRSKRGGKARVVKERKNK